MLSAQAPRSVAVQNRSTLVTDAQVATMVGAIDMQMRRDVEPAWSLPRIPVGVLSRDRQPAAGAPVIVLVDTADDPEALGYHTENGGIASGVVGCKPELDHGAHVLDGAYSVASVLSHEVLELAVDPRCNLWADTGARALVAFELCDPVQSDYYPIDGFGRAVTVSNFVLPAWFDAQSPAGTRVDYLGNLHGPFTMSRGGYLVTMREGHTSQKFGDQMPGWLRGMKFVPITRTSRRADTL